MDKKQLAVCKEDIPDVELKAGDYCFILENLDGYSYSAFSLDGKKRYGSYFKSRFSTTISSFLVSILYG